MTGTSRRTKGFREQLPSLLMNVYRGRDTVIQRDAPASNEFPPPVPRAWNIACPKRGNPKPNMERKTLGHGIKHAGEQRGRKLTEAAATALAAYENVSTKYNWMGKLSGKDLRSRHQNTMERRVQGGHHACPLR